MSDDTSKNAPQEPDFKVTDKRMFTAEGELREEYRDVGEKDAGEAAADRGAETTPGGSGVVTPGSPGAPADAPAAGSPAPGAMPGAGPSGAPMEIPGPGPDPDPGPGPGPAPAFLDLVALLAEPVALYLGDAQTPDGQSHENLEAARLHIDLLDVLREKTSGNLSAQESGILEDVLYRLRMRYVQKQG